MTGQALSTALRPRISPRAGAGRGRRRAAGTVLRAIAAALGGAALAGTSLAIPVAAASPAASPPNYGSTTVTVETLAGADLYGTAIAISQNVSPDGGLPVVYLISAASGGDAATAGWAAAREGGVVLYTAATSLPQAVADELVRLMPSRVEVMGGSSAIADSVLSQVVALLPASAVERVSGSDAFDTAAVLSARSFQANTGATFHAITPGRVLDSRIGLGATRFTSKVKQSFAVAGLFGVPADAVGVTGNVTIVGQTQAGYVTVAPSLTADALPSTSTINFPVGDIRANGITVSLGPGGKLDAVYAAEDDTSMIDVIFDVTGYFANDPPGGPYHASATVVVASADSLAEAVVAGSVAAKLDAPFLLVTRNSVPAATAAELRRLTPNHVILVGDASSVAETVLTQIRTTAPNVERVAGADRYATAGAGAARFFPNATAIVAMSGLTLQAAAASIPLSAARTAPILLAQDTDLLPVLARDVLISLKPSLILFVGSMSELNRAEMVGFSDGRLTRPADTTAYPGYDSGYHDPGELYTVIKAHEIAFPTLVRISSIGKSYQGRDIWAAQVSSDVTVDHGKPETLVDALYHAREHIGVEQALYLLETLTSQYAADPYVTHLVNERVTWIVFAVNPDGWVFDLAGGQYHEWRKNRQPAAGSSAIGTDINRNFAYQWGCCGGSSGSPWAWNYRGSAPFSAPEAQAIRNLVGSRVIDGKQRIKTHLALHANGELILYPYCYTTTALPADMTADDHAVFVAMAQAMAGMNGYRYEQSSSMYVTDGDEIDWLYHTYGIFAFTIELYPTEQYSSADFYPPYSVVPAQTARNRAMLLYAIDAAACPYEAIGKAAQYCPGAPAIVLATGR
jgi:carboxypeptidase T